jgi:cytoskeletal protein CcmA (bactofilin family)
MFHRPRDENTEPEERTGNENGANISPNSPAAQAAGKTSNPVTQSKQQKETQPMSQNQPEEKNEQSQEKRNADIPANMQRMQQTPPGASRIPGSYASNYQSYSGTAMAGGETGSSRKLIVGQGINLSGEIEACDHLIVEGKVEATLKGASLLDVAEGGVFYGTVEIEEATIAGRFEGDLTVAGRLTIKSTGSITGAIAYRELAVEAGATVDGKIGPLKDRSENKKTENKTKATENVQQRPKETQQQAAAEEEGLPFVENTAEAAE